CKINTNLDQNKPFTKASPVIPSQLDLHKGNRTSF
ncbi:unnamed protein product, partial [Arabidopsis halleri]